MRKKKIVIPENEIIDVPLEEEMKKSFVDYSAAVIGDRALPRPEDGLKPVVRRILYSLEELNMTHDKPHRKSARVVGDTLGKWHPHGDNSIYMAMVRQGQWWAVRYPLVNIHGNYGSIDGDSPAAMRYTEVRMEAIAESFLKDLKKDTVDWKPNFDDTMLEPKTLPTLIPNFILNGVTGIAVGVSCEIPSHNIVEIVQGIIQKIDKPKSTIQDIMEYVKGPDLATGGVLESSNFESFYTSGRGSFRVRSTYHIEKIDKSKLAIVFTEIPYNKKKSSILGKLGNLFVDKKINGVTDIRDETTLDDGMRIIIEFKNDVDPNYILKTVFKLTDLEVSQSVIMHTIVNGQLKLIGLLEYFDIYLNYQKGLIFKRTNYTLSKLRKELNIQEGYAICLDDIYAVVDVITRSRTPKTAKLKLMETFGLNELQAQAILDLRLSKLTSLGKNEVKERIAALNKQVKKLEKIIASDKNMFIELKENLLIICIEDMKEFLATILRTKNKDRITENLKAKSSFTSTNIDYLLNMSSDKVFKEFGKQTDKEILKILKKLKKISDFNNISTKELDLLFKNKLINTSTYGDKRRSKIVKEFDEIEAEIPIVDFNIVIKDRDIKTFQTKNFKYDGDYVLESNNNKYLHLISKNGDSYRYAPDNIPKKVQFDVIGAYVSDFIDDTRVLTLVTKKGQIKRSSLNDYNIARASAAAIKLAKDDEIIYTILEDEESSNKLICFNENKEYNCIETKEIKITKRLAKGVKLIALEDDQEITAIKSFDEIDTLILSDGKKEKVLNKEKIKVSTHNRKYPLNTLLQYGFKSMKVIDYKLN